MKTMTFAMGLPGAGKSTVLATGGYLQNAVCIDPDQIKESHAEYDPKNPQLLHAWSTEVAERQFQAALASESNYVVDGTGTNSEKMVRRIRQAQAAGFMCRLVFVRVSTKTAMARNASRARSVPDQIIREKALDMATSFEIVSAAADEIRVIDND